MKESRHETEERAYFYVKSCIDTWHNNIKLKRENKKQLLQKEDFEKLYDKSLGCLEIVNPNREDT